MPVPMTLRAKYREQPAIKRQKSPANGNNTHKSPQHKGLRWATVRAWSRRGTNCVGCSGNPWSKK